MENYRANQLNHLRTNLFVNPELANIVGSPLIDTRKEIEKLELGIRKIQNDYKSLTNEDTIIFGFNKLNLNQGIIDRLEKHGIKDSHEFMSKDYRWFSNIGIDNYTYEMIKKAIQDKIAELKKTLV